MSKKETIQIDISPNVEVVLQTEGFAGKSCMGMDEALKGLKKVETELTSDYYKKEKPTEVVIRKGN